jgi:DNA replication protein DnaC
MMTSNRPPEDWGKLVGEILAATAILDCFLHYVDVITITATSYRLRSSAAKKSTRKPVAPSPVDCTEPGA